MNKRKRSHSFRREQEIYQRRKYNNNQDKRNYYDAAQDGDYENNHHGSSFTYDDVKICKFYNPYFQSGCEHGPYCLYAHLSEAEFLAFVRELGRSRESAPDLYASNAYEQALHCIDMKHIKSALTIFTKLVSSYEFNGRFNFWLARCYQLINTSEEYFESDYGSAEYYYRRAISIDPANAPFHSYYAQFSVLWAKRGLDVGDIKVAHSKSKQARRHFSKSLHLKSVPLIHFKYAKFLDEVQNDFDFAAKQYKIALRHFGNDSKCRLNYAKLLFKMERYHLSYKQFLLIIQLEKSSKPNRKNHKNGPYVWNHYHFALLLKSMNKYVESAKQFSLCIKLEPDRFGEIYFEYALLLIDCLKDTEKGLKYLQMACNISPHRSYYKSVYDEVKQQEINYYDHQQQQHEYEQPEYEQQEVDDIYYYQQEVDQHQEEKQEEEEQEEEEQEEEEHDDEDAEDDDDASSTIDEGLANRCCESEWDRFISRSVDFGENLEFERYYDRFDDEQVNDIRWLLTKKVLKDSFLSETIGMSDSAISIWKKSVNDFNAEYNKYVEWLQHNNWYNNYFEKFKKYGILNLNSFFYHVKTQQDVIDIIGKKHQYDAQQIWKAATYLKNDDY